ncbi:MAG TPA: hypothetical protein VMJ10_32900 [Kofleriaceae bacterium]|nr:hypothetical protein [Kofleriaceae bacterium]
MRSLLFVLLAACSSDPPSPATVRAHVDSDLGNVLAQGETALAGVTSALPAPTAFALAGLGADVPPSFDAGATTAWLDANVFADGNYIGDGTFALPCAACPSDVQPRVRVEQDDDGALRFAIELDPAHDEPLSFLLAHDSLAIALDLDGADAATAALAEWLGEAAPTAMTQGAASARIAVTDDSLVQVAVSIDRPIMVAVAPGGTPLSADGALRLAADVGPVFAADLDGSAAAGSISLALGEVVAHTPDGVDLDLAGATGNATLGGGMLTLTNVSLGAKTTTITRGGAPALALDLNPLDGRTLAATVARDADGAPTLAVSPRLDLERWVDHGVLGDAPPVYDVTSLVVDGTLVAGGADVRVATGALAATTAPATYSFDAAAGQCVTASAATDPATGSAFTSYAVGACP